MRCVIARVLPVPAPASTQTGPRQASATSRCSGSRAASRSSGSIRHILPHARPGGRPAREARDGESCCNHPKTPAKQSAGPQNNEEIPVPLTMYTTTWCGFCKNLKRQLGRAGIEVTEVDIELDPAAAEFVMSVNGGNQTVPTLLFGDGSTMCNPSAAQVQKKLAQLASPAG